MDNNTKTVILLAALGFLVAWFVPSILVGLHAANNGFRFWSFFVVALFLSWPLALFGDVLLGARSPLARASGQALAPLQDTTVSHRVHAGG